MKRSALKRRTRLKRNGRLNPRSKKTRARTADDKTLSKIVLLRDLTCRTRNPGVCVGMASHAHHVVQKSVRPDLRLNPEVCIGVCGPCHTWIHSQWERPTSDDPDEVLADPSELWIVTAGMADRWLTAGGQQQIGVGR